ncbi:MAG: 30S ribosomal protein S9 [Candidatus Wildermuthbacteria bacterium]|nr:30S ribosomal protein S9 [Candidatus Wildermuthbacteria bacterium]
MPKTEGQPKTAYFEGVGGRKTSTSRVRIAKAKAKDFFVNGKPLEAYFQNAQDQRICREPLEKGASDASFAVSVKVQGGGIGSQAEAVRHGLARALILWKPELKSQLKQLGFLKRDPRMRERKKFGLRRARRATQWSKR